MFFCRTKISPSTKVIEAGCEGVETNFSIVKSGYFKAGSQIWVELMWIARQESKQMRISIILDTNPQIIKTAIIRNTFYIHILPSLCEP